MHRQLTKERHGVAGMASKFISGNCEARLQVLATDAPTLYVHARKTVGNFNIYKHIPSVNPLTSHKRIIPYSANFSRGNKFVVFVVLKNPRTF